jgi:ATP-dependent DNA helicase RecQ
MSRFLRDLARPSGPPGRTVDRSAPAGVVARPSTAGPSDDALFAALRAWRLERARGDKVAPYIVAHDALLAEIARFRPRSLASLRQVKGMGAAKVERFGDEILAVVTASAGDATDGEGRTDGTDGTDGARVS